MKRAWALAAALMFTAFGAASAQPQQDPFGGRFGVMELALPPDEAARQAELMGAALSGLQPQRAGVVDTYVMVASLWGDPVFEREASQAEAILRAHFDAEGRSILLSAGTGALSGRQYPGSSPNNLSAALGKIGSLIDPQEDLVVLFVTSHGSPDGAALREDGRLDATLRPVHLRDMLAAANIRNRVVIVSACFSGVFLAPLADDRTVVLTAAAPNRSSFGCQPENDWTFFGDALFNHGMRNGAELLPAFDQAKTLIQRWERAQNLTPPSNPQRWAGPRGVEILAQAERGAR